MHVSLHCMQHMTLVEDKLKLTSAKLRIELDMNELAEDQLTASECASRHGAGAC